jgi:hypothetical protein
MNRHPVDRWRLDPLPQARQVFKLSYVDLEISYQLIGKLRHLQPEISISKKAGCLLNPESQPYALIRIF